jgi:hypothetical protein
LVRRVPERRQLQIFILPRQSVICSASSEADARLFRGSTTDESTMQFSLLWIRNPIPAA